LLECAIHAAFVVVKLSRTALTGLGLVTGPGYSTSHRGWPSEKSMGSCPWTASEPSKKGGNMKLLAYALLMVLSLSFNSIAIECPKMPEQANKEWDVEVKVAVGKIGPVKGAELETRTRKAVKDLMGKLPEADKVYLEQMMYATYCSALRDDKTLSESEKASRIRAYNLEVRRTLYKMPDKTSGDKQSSLPVDKRMEARLRLSQVSVPFTSKAFVEHAKKGDVDVVKLFLAAGMDPNAKDNDGNTALTHAVRQGHRGVIDVLLKAKASVNEKNKGGWTALSAATDPDKKDILMALLKQRPNVHALNSAFLGAASDGDREMADMLKKKGADVRAIWDGTRIIDLALLFAVRRGGSVSEEDLNETVKYLLDFGADVNTREQLDRTPLMWAIEANHLNIARTLLNRGADVNLRAVCDCLHSGWTALMFAARYGRPAFIGPLLDKGADIDVKCDRCYTGVLENGSTALMLAVQRSKEVAEILINRNADLGRRDEKGRSALLLAALRGHPTTLNALIDKGLDINQRDNDGYTALMHASQMCKVDNVSILLDKGADMNIKNNVGETALMAAIRRCGQGSKTLPLLLGKSRDINAKTNEGKTALMMAAEGGQIETVKSLIEQGADVKEKNIYGKSAEDFAEKSKLTGEEKEKMLWMLKTAADVQK
jgi:ankyrin repeat protein/IS1 family transposase